MVCTDKNCLLELTVSEFAAAAGGSVADWSRWFSGARDIKASSLLEPAEHLGITPGELLDIILERRRRCLQSNDVNCCDRAKYAIEGWSDYS